MPVITVYNIHEHAAFILGLYYTLCQYVVIHGNDYK